MKRLESQKTMIKKIVQRSEECFIQFTEDELNELNIKPGDKFSWKIDGESIVLDKHVKVDFDISDWPKESLEFLIQESINEDISVNDVIVNIIERYVEHNNVD